MVDSTENFDAEEKFVEEYVEQDDEYFDSALKTNIKTDPSLVKPKRKPVQELSLEDEIPPLPKKEDILSKPNDSHYEKLIKEIKGKIDAHKKSVEDTRAKIQKEKFGVSNAEIDEKNKILAELTKIKAENEEHSKTINGVRDQIKKLKDEKDTLQKELDVTSPEGLNKEIKKIQDKLGYGQISLTEEKTLIDRKRKLESQKEKVKKFNTLREQIKVLYSSNDELFKKSDQIKKVREEIKGRLKAINDKFDKQRTEKKVNDEIVNQQKEIISNIYKEIDALKEKKKEIEKEWNNKWYAYEDQQRFIGYIERAQKRKAYLLRQEQRKKEDEEYQKAQNLKKANKIVASSVYAEKIEVANWVIKYFNGLIASEQSQTSSTPGDAKQDEKKSTLKPIAKKQEDSFFPTSSVVETGKKKKGPKVSKREKEFEKSLDIDLGLIKQIKEVGVNPPVLKTDIPNFIKLVQTKIEEFKKLNEEEKLKAETELKKAQEETSQVTPSGETPTGETPGN